MADLVADSINVSDSSPTLIYSGRGRLILDVNGSDLVTLGGSSVSYGDGLLTSGATLDLYEDTDVYGIAQSYAKAVRFIVTPLPAPAPIPTGGELTLEYS